VTTATLACTTTRPRESAEVACVVEAQFKPLANVPLNHLL